MGLLGTVVDKGIQGFRVVSRTLDILGAPSAEEVLPFVSPFLLFTGKARTALDLADFVLDGLVWATENPDAFAILILSGAAIAAGGVFVIQPIGQRVGNWVADKVAIQIKEFTGETV